ncbi:MAG: HigA family addiction module antidote protein [Gammaproteobacteria bacterium]|nr:HigA family addiction module antidote protein [Gammaproteobacteria bacterium]
MSVRNGMRPVHPGEVLRDEIDALDMSAKALAQELDVPPNRITAILHGQRGVTADTALRLSRYLGTTPEFWLNLQKTFELRIAEMEAGESIAKRIKPRPEAA